MMSGHRLWWLLSLWLVAAPVESQTTAYNVTLVLSLDFLEPLTAAPLEVGNASHPVTQHFCQAVHEQASGKQVQLAAGDAVQIETRMVVANDTTDYECTIVATHRDYDSDADVFGDDYFALQVQVVVVVYVTTAMNVTSETVRGWVEAGFARGTGGRVRFRALLQENAAFRTVWNTEVLERLSQTSTARPSPRPTLVPSLSPISRPTDRPSRQPTRRPSPLPTREPSSSPTFVNEPSNRPTVVGSSIEPSAGAWPSNVPSNVPTLQPSLWPSLQPTSPPSLRPSRRPVTLPAPVVDEPANPRWPLVLGAALGGVVTILVSLFFVFCVWFPFCTKAPEHSSTILDGGPHCRGSPTTRRDGRIVFPSIVQLGDGDESLADTTLGGYTSEPTKRGIKTATASLSPLAKVMDSFDDSSIYTSGADMTVSDVQPTGKRTLTVLPPSLSRALDYEEEIFFPSDGSATTDPGADGRGVKSRSGDSLSSRPGSTHTSPTAKMHETVKNDEARATAVARSMDAGTQGFDPFAENAWDSSSFDFDSEPGVPTEKVMHGLEERSTPSSNSSQTKRIENLILNAAAAAGREHLIQPSEEEKREIEDEIRQGIAELDTTPRTKPFSPRKPSAIPKMTENNNLLRTVLEDARRLANSKGTSRSRASRQSAPSRLAASRQAKTTRRELVPPSDDLLADNGELERFIALSSQTPAKKSSQSVGPAISRRQSQLDRPRTRSSSSLAEYSKASANFMQSQAAATGSTTSPTQPHARGASARPRFLPAKGSPAQTRPIQRQSDSSPPSMSPRTPLKNESPSATPWTSRSPGTLGAEPRDQELDALHRKHGIPGDTPASSPGILGITMQKDARVTDDGSSGSEGLSNPWLFDTIEQTLGPRSPNADMESISGRSNRSQKSGRSARSKAKGRRSSRQHASSTGRDSVPGRLSYASSRPSTAAPIIDGSFGEQKTEADEPLAPRSLDYDLRRLEIQLSEALQPETDHMTTSTITASSAGAGRAVSKRAANRLQQKRVVVIVPPGKLGVVLAKRQDGRGTIVSEIRPSSAMHGMMSPGDRLVEIDGHDVTEMGVDQITTFMNSRAARERRLTLLTSVYQGMDAPATGLDAEAKLELDSFD